MTTTNVSHNGSDSLEASDQSLEQDSALQAANAEGGMDIVFLAEDIDNEQAVNNSDVSSLESSLARPSADLSLRSTQSLKKKTGKRAFAFANRMAMATDVENLYQIAVTEIRKRFQVERGLIYRFHSETQGTVIAESQSGGYRPMLGEVLPAIVFGQTDAEGYKQRPSVAIADANESTITPYQTQLFNQFQVRASLSLPIFLENQLWGLLVIQQCDRPREWDENEIGFLYLVASELQINLQPLNFQLERQLLTKLSDKLRQASDKETVFRSTTRDIRKFLDVDRVAICQFRQDYTLQFVSESKVGHVSPMLDVVLADSHLKAQEGGIFQQNKPFVVHHVEQDQNLTPCHIENLTDYDIQACAIVAIYQGQKLWGLLGAYQHGSARHWDSNEVRLLTQTADLVGVSLHQSELMAEMNRASKNQEALPEIINKISNTAY
ncbi:MAG: GAF domain-containing protein, partial [Cyanobacteria bacterium J06650_10]